jgi:hypothetical protein
MTEEIQEVVECNEACEVNIHKQIIDLKKDIETQFIKLGAFLKLVRDRKLYKEKDCDTFESYIAQPELSLDRSTVFAIIGVFEDFFEKSNQSDLVEVGYAKLNRIRQFKGKPNFEEWIEKSKVLSLSDLNAEIKEAKGEPEIIHIPKEKSYTVTCPFCNRIFQHVI